MPSNSGSLRLVQWPLFLLSSKVGLPGIRFYAERQGLLVSVTVSLFFLDILGGGLGF